MPGEVFLEHVRGAPYVRDDAQWMRRGQPPDRCGVRVRNGTRFLPAHDIDQSHAFREGDVRCEAVEDLGWRGYVVLPGGVVVGRSQQG